MFIGSVGHGCRPSIRPRFVDTALVTRSSMAAGPVVPAGAWLTSRGCGLSGAGYVTSTKRWAESAARVIVVAGDFTR
jgi:hypothetical protein